MVSEWMENGDINEFVERDQHVNRAELVRCHFGPYEARLMYRPAGWRCEWLEVYA